MSVPDNGRRRPLIIAGLAVAIALVAGVTIALVSVNGADRPTSLSSDAKQIILSTSAEPTTTTTVTSTTATTSSTAATTTSTTTAAPPRTTTKRPQPTTAAAPVQQVSPTASAFETSVLSLVNKQRESNGCGDLRWDDRLAVAARKHSQDMAVRNFFDHNTPEGVDPWQRIKAEGYTNPSGENIAAGQSTPDAVMTSWMNSPGHRANILNCKSKAVGVGMYKGGSYGIYWTQDFGFE